MAPEPTIRRAPRPRPSRPRPPHPRRPHPVGRRLALAVATLLLLTGAAALGVASPPDAAEASVTPARGFRATVLGWSSWYGSYAMGSMGSAWCIDHGLRAPDPSFRYVPAAAPDLDAGTGAAISWIVTAHGSGDALDAAAVMLAVHDLRRASYPFGVIDVDRLTTRDLAGFGGREAEVLGRARALKAEARAHGSLRAPFHLMLTLMPNGEPAGTADPADPAGTAARDVDGRVTARLTDAGGRPVVGAGVALAAKAAELDGAPSGATGADGSFTASYRTGAAVPGQLTQFEAHAIVPDPVPATFASSTVRAQRVVRSAWLGLEARGTPTPAVTTTSTSTTSISTTATTSTSTSSPPRSTIPPGSTTSTTSPTLPPTTSTTPPPTSSTSPPPLTSSTVVTGSVPQPPSGPPSTAIESLPRTGGHTAGWALIGAGLVLLGATLLAVSRGWAR